MTLTDTLKNKKLFIFDMDGTITDTEPLHYEAYRRTMEALCPPQTIGKEEFLRCYVGHPETEIYSLLKKNKKIDFDDGVFFETRINNLFELVRESSLTTAPFYRQLEELFPHAHFITLTSQRVSVLERFRQALDYGKIEKFISVADKSYNKSDVLADTMKYLGFEASECVIFEDFAPTLHAAMDNGIYAVGVQHEFNALRLSDCNALIRIDRKI